MIIQANPLGIVIGLIFIAAIGMPFFLMFRVPSPPPPPPVPPAPRSRDKIDRILIPIGPDLPFERAVELACRSGSAEKRELVLVYVIVVPYILSLNTPLPEQDRAASDALDLAYMIAEQYGCSVRMYIVRHRSAAGGILQVAREEQVDAIMLRIGEGTRLRGGWDRMSSEILHRAKCEVFVDKVPLAAQPVALGT